MLVRPKVVFKYKSIATCDSFRYLLDIITNNRIYLPKPSEVNDPLEACAVQLRLAYAGGSYGAIDGKISRFVESAQEEYKVLSFSSIPNSSVMWANYADNSAGCCLIFRTDVTLQDIRPVIYTDSVFQYSEIDFGEHDLSEYVEEALLFKKKDWAYENEWRNIEKTDSTFLPLKKGELCGVILGRRTDTKTAKKITDACSKNGIPCYRVYVLKNDGQLVIIPNILGKEDYFTIFDMHNYLTKEDLSEIEIDNIFLLKDYLMKEQAEE